MMTTASWTRAAQVQASLPSLQGFWADDLWDMHHSPVKDLSLQCEAAPTVLQVQVFGDQWRVEVCMLEEVFWRRLAKHAGDLPHSSLGSLVE